ncbi:hypothetical protein [Lysinibacillus sp. Ag94]|uniref:hypothetical protein n=1 Tax=Lysinibacillus sp. Ag94 TaxID=2936682 RepID=UPI00200BCC5A|nr:hypothetical protein [Lysinibacillus sp. Ag94]UPW83555.1 hypothetical protein MY533_01365 [Lysinibacillus sp. Ag94]
MFSANVYRILIASPSDVAEERKIISEVVHTWNEKNASHYHAVILPVKWETHSIPELGSRPQAIINKQLVDYCDILVGAFWTRLGSKTGVAESGSAEEIEEFRSKNKPVMLYFSSAPVAPASLDMKQYSKLKTYKDKLMKEGLLESYTSLSEFREKLDRQLTALIRNINHTSQDNVTSVQDNEEIVKNSKKQLLSFIYQMELEWESERDSNPYSTTNGKHILSSLASGLIDNNSILDEILNPNSMIKIKEIIRTCKILQNHQIFLDGGKSFGEFWKIGNSVFEELKSQVEQK